jgi:hypothetical protein
MLDFICSMLADDAGMAFRESAFEALLLDGIGGALENRMATLNFLNIVNFCGAAGSRVFSAQGS